MREAWGRLIDSQEETGHRFASLYKQFVDWFFPYFSAYSFVLMREHEKEADREAARMVGVKPMGEALILIETKGRTIDDDFWRSVHEENIVSEKPVEKLFSRMVGSLAFVNDEATVQKLSKAIAVPTDFNDTHPALSDRLKLIGYWNTGDIPPLPDKAESDSATVFLGAAVQRFTEQFDTQWDISAGETWKQRYDYFQETDKRIRELEEKRISDGELTAEDLRELARLFTERDGVGAAMPVIEEAAAKFPDQGVIWYNLGLARLSQDDDGGLKHLKKAVELDASLKFDADQLAFEYLRSKGRIEEARQYAHSMDEQTEIYDKAQKERTAAFPEEKFQEHDLPQEYIDTIGKKIAGLDEITAIYAAHKVVKHLPEFPYRVLFIDVRKKGRIKNRHDADPLAIFEIIVDRFSDGEFHFFALLNGKWAGTKYYLDRIPNAKIYQRPDK